MEKDKENVGIDRKTMAKNIASSASEAQSRSPVSSGDGGLESDSANRFINRLERMADSGAYAELDNNFIHQARAAQTRARAGKKLASTSFASSLGSLRQRMADAEFERRQQQAKQGFIGSGAEANQVVQSQRAVKNTLADSERQYLDQLGQLNTQIKTARQSEAEALRPLFPRGFAQEAAIRSNTNGAGNLYGLKSDEGFFGKLAGAFGKDQESVGELNEEAFKANAGIQQLASELGVNIEDANFMDKVKEQMKSVVTGTAGSVYDRTTDIYMDLGNGSKKVGETTKSWAKTIMDDIFGAINVGALAAVAVTGGASVAAAAGIGGAEAGVAGIVEGAMLAGEEAGGAMLAETLSSDIGTLAASAGMDSTEFVAGYMQDGFLEAMTAELGEEATAEMTGSLQASIMNTLEENLPAELISSQSLASINTAVNTASKTLQQAIIQTGAMPSEEAIQAALTNALAVMENSEMITTMAVAEVEAGAGAAGATETGLATEGVAADSAAVSGESSAVSNSATNQKPPIEEGGMFKGAIDKVTQKIKNSGIIKFGKVPFQVVKQGSKQVWKSPAGKSYVLATGAANVIRSLIPQLKELGLSPDDVDKRIVQALEEATQGENNAET